MRSRRPASSARTWFVCRRLRFRLVAFLVRMWLRLAWPALYLPEAVFRKRLAAPRCVLILGIAISLGSFLVLAWAASTMRTHFPSCLAGWQATDSKGSRAGPEVSRTAPRTNRAGHYAGSRIPAQCCAFAPSSACGGRSGVRRAQRCEVRKSEARLAGAPPPFALPRKRGRGSVGIAAFYGDYFFFGAIIITI